MAANVSKGQITFDAEGNDIEKSLYFSRVIHWPGNALSGVTIGRGYDMGNRTRFEVKRDMIRAGILESQAESLSKGAGLKGLKARAFVDTYQDEIGKITHAQQVGLFDNIYSEYEERAVRNYNKWTAGQRDRVEWGRLDQPIRDILVDFVYQGFTRGPNPMRAGMNNDYDELIRYIEGTPAIKQYERGRNRAGYLSDRRPVGVAGVGR